ncbi:MAG TPA: lysophospholipid acyltransferase family protein [Gemmataceae bacterium]|nr:lysophospholipid acyltransferase family protein [Gemmataceae bacterium]
MSKPRFAVADYAVYLAVRVLLCAVQMLTLPTARRLAGVLAWLAYHIDRRHRLVADDNLKHAYAGQLNDRERDRMVRGVYRHFVSVLVEIAHLPRMLNPNTWRRYVTLENGRAIVEGLLCGRPLLFVTGHFGNWELGGYVLGLLGFQTYAIARKLDNPHLNAFLLHRIRERTGQKILYKDGDFDRIQAALASGGAVATLGDQDAGARGQFVDFFGRPASTHKAVALLALEFNTPMVVIGMPRVGQPMRYRIVAEEVILPEEYAGRPDAVRAITQRFTAALERLARRAPEQYFWLHRRWKHEPPVRKGKRAA